MSDEAQANVVDDRMPFTVLVPDSPYEPIELFDQSAALRMTLVDIQGVSRLDASWDSPGVYVLLDRVDEENQWTAYVGQAAAGLRSRVSEHVRSKDGWRRALLVRRDTTYGFHSAQVGWLEGRLHDLLTASEAAVVRNRQKPGDSTLPPYDIAMLEATMEPIARAMRMFGYDPASADDAPGHETRRGRKHTHHGVRMSDLFAAGMVQVGQRLVSMYPIWPADARIAEGGRIDWDGQLFDTPSGAGDAAVKSQGHNSGVNGWEYWAIETPTGRVALSVLRARFMESRNA